MSKRGQVSQFILMGIVLILAISVITYVRHESIFFRPSVVLPAKVQPVAEFVETCVKDYGTEALELAGYQGGWVELPDYINYNPSTYINYGGLKKPYWYYGGRVIAPTIEQVETELADYLDKELPYCLNNLSVFENEFEIKIYDEPKTTVQMGEKAVTFNLEYPIKLTDKTNRTKTKVLNFQSIVPIAFKELYDFGKRILEMENREMFFEKATVDMMGMNKNIPFTGLNFKCISGPMEWAVADISREIRGSLTKDIHRIRIKNSDYVPFYDDESVYEDIHQEFGDVEGKTKIIEGTDLPDYVPMDAYDYFHYFWDIGIEPSRFKVNFNYLPDYGIRLKVRPSEKGVMKSNVAKGTSYLNFLCLHIYHFSYDVNYPVEVMLRDDESLNGEGYVLRYAFPVIIDHNVPNRQRTSSSIFDAVPSTRDYSVECEDKEGDYTVIANGYDEYLFEGELNNVSIAYDCLKYMCELGNTGHTGESYHNLNTALPTGCLHGFVEASKEGYLITRKQVTVEDMETGLIEFWMPKLQNFNYSVVKQKYYSETDTFGEEEPFNGTASINLKVDELKFDERVLLGQEKDINILAEEAMTYRLEITLLDTNDTIVGGFMGDWTFGLDFIDKEKIVFKTFEYWPTPANEDEEMNMYIYLGEGNYTEILKPRFE